MNRGEKFQVHFGLNTIGYELMRSLKTEYKFDQLFD